MRKLALPLLFAGVLLAFFLFLAYCPLGRLRPACCCGNCDCCPACAAPATRARCRCPFPCRCCAGCCRRPMPRAAD
jgi:hypothetical protein